jgi:hypothetical protein
LEENVMAVPTPRTPTGIPALALSLVLLVIVLAMWVAWTA